MDVTLDEVRASRERIAPFVRTTPVVEDRGLVYKLEFLQHTGSFKPRGAFNTMLQLDTASRERGIAAVSGGNHGLATAYAGHVLGVRTAIFMAQGTPQHICDRVRALGAVVDLSPTIAEAFERCRQSVAETGSTLLHPFDDDRVIAGQGTIGLEILEQFTGLRRAVISIGGGGLIVGVAGVLKQLRPDVQIVGVETRGADAMHRAIAAGAVVDMPGITSIARTLGAPSVAERTLRGTQALVDDVVLVDDRDAVAAINELQESLGITVEPAAACTLAALRTGAIPPLEGTLLLMCGRNVRLHEIAEWNRRFLAP